MATYQSIALSPQVGTGRDQQQESLRDRQHEMLYYLTLHYLASIEARQRFLNYLQLDYGPCLCEESYVDRKQKSKVVHRVVNHNVYLEQEVVDNQSGPPDIIGFLGVMLEVTVEYQHREVRQRFKVHAGLGKEEWTDYLDGADFSYTENKKFAVQVEVSPRSVSDMIRRINNISRITTFESWILVTPFALSPAEKECLADENIRHLRLGPKFYDYLAQRQAEMDKTGAVI